MALFLYLKFILMELLSMCAHSSLYTASTHVVGGGGLGRACYHSIIIITIIQDHLYSVSPGLGLFITLIIIIIIQDHHCLVTPGLCQLSLSHLDCNLDRNSNVRSDVMSCILSN